MFNEKELARFFSKIDKTEGGCWLWKATLFSNGYGQFFAASKNMRAHRASYLIHKGAIPDGLLVLHKCDVRHCVNPDHLSAGTQMDNVRDCVAKKRSFHGKRTRCQNGHDYTDENTYVNSAGWRFCRVCMRQRAARHYHKKHPNSPWRTPYGQRRSKKTSSCCKSQPAD